MPFTPTLSALRVQIQLRPGLPQNAGVHVRSTAPGRDITPPAGQRSLCSKSSSPSVSVCSPHHGTFWPWLLQNCCQVTRAAVGRGTAEFHGLERLRASLQPAWHHPRSEHCRPCDRSCFCCSGPKCASRFIPWRARTCSCKAVGSAGSSAAQGSSASFGRSGSRSPQDRCANPGEARRPLVVFPEA